MRRNYRSKKSNFNVAIKKVYKELRKNNINWYKLKQTARFVCALTIYWPNNKFIIVNGKIEGTISRFKKGNNGFGYDPLFYIDEYECTAAELPKQEKNIHSHRAKAMKSLCDYLAECTRKIK